MIDLSLEFIQNLSCFRIGSIVYRTISWEFMHSLNQWEYISNFFFYFWSNWYEGNNKISSFSWIKKFFFDDRRLYLIFPRRLNFIISFLSPMFRFNRKTTHSVLYLKKGFYATYELIIYFFRNARCCFIIFLC